MKKTDVAIIGASAAGLTAAVTLKMRSPEKSVIVLRNVKNTVVPCGIPYIYGTLNAVEKNVIPDEMFSQMGIEIVAQHVSHVDPKGKTITLENGQLLAYDKLVLGTGSKPFMPPMPGIDLANVFAIHKDPERLQELFDALKSAKRVVVVGGGFIGVEMSEQIAAMEERPDEVTLVEALPHCLMQAVEEEFCQNAETILRLKGIQVLTGVGVEALEGDETVTGVRLANGQVLNADLVLVGLGARPNIDLAQQMGLACDTHRGVKVDSTMRSENPDVFAVGDCAGKFSPITGKSVDIRLGSTACSEGMIAACNLYGGSRTTPGAVGAFATSIGGMGLGSVGLTSAAARAEGIEIVTGEAEGPNRHPGNLPGCVPDMKAILHFRKEDGKVVGGHIRGDSSAADLINIVAVAIQGGLTAEQMATMQYATHPLLTASPMQYQVMLAAEKAAATLSI